MIFQTGCAHLGSLEELEEDEPATFHTCEQNDDFSWLLQRIYDNLSKNTFKSLNSRQDEKRAIKTVA